MTEDEMEIVIRTAVEELCWEAEQLPQGCRLAEKLWRIAARLGGEPDVPTTAIEADPMQATV